MNADLIARNLLLYSAQIAILIAVCGGFMYALRLHAPKPRVLFWHIVLTICVALPFLEPWRAPSVAADASVTQPPSCSGRDPLPTAGRSTSPGY